jgi:uncharacterized protein with PIN domain
VIDREVTEIEILTNEIRRLTIERDRYHAALERARRLLSPLVYLSLSKGIEQAQEVDQELQEAARFRAWGCPRCDTPCELTFSMAEFSSDYQSWDCPECGKIGGPLTAEWLAELQALSEFRCAVLAKARGEEPTR